MPTSSSSFVVSNEALETFGELDYRIYAAVHDSGQQFLDMRVTDLAHKARVSNSAIVRFCKKCGYSGLKELKQSYVSQLSEAQQALPLPSVMTDLRAMVDQGDFVQYQQGISDAFRLIRRAKGIVFAGHGTTIGVAMYGASLFNELEFGAIPLVSFPAHIPPLVNGQVALIFTQSGMEGELVAATNELSSKGCQIVAVTGHAESPIANLADICIRFGTPLQQGTHDANLSTCIPAVYVVEQLARMLYNEHSHTPQP